ncbi:MATE family efflux transporter [Paenibacillus humicola]|uniref:MATE family efflux transporter n=1 Tax=Paenibacillus humicola TaxID=3110540 RepID=UPI00237B7CB2|nr:MATE family efflux transporter [Paenibacillus humicola]
MLQLNFRTRKQAFLDKYLTGESIDYRQIVSLFVPILVDQAFIIGLNMLNTAMISSSGVAAVSAVNMVDSLNIFLISVFIAVSTGGTVVVAQYKGSGNDLMVSRAAASAVTSVSLLALLLCVFIGIFHNLTLTALFGSASADVFSNAKTYLVGSSLSYMGIALTEAVCGALRGIGRTRASLALSMIMNFSYVLLNVLFINLLHMGVVGMALSVNIARYGAAVCALFYLMKMDTNLHVQLQDLLKLNVAMIKRILLVGIPFAAEQLFFNGGKMLTQVFIVSLGTYAIATNAICGSIAGVLQIPANALALTTVTVVGQCMGRRNVEDARKFTKTFLGLSACACLLMGMIVVPLFHPIVSLFHPPEAIVPDIFKIVILTSILQIPFWSFSFLMPSALRAAGDSKFTSIVSMLSMWLFRIVLGYILGIVLHFGIVGVWLAMNCEWGVRGAIFLRRFYGKKWYRHRVID